MNLTSTAVGCRKPSALVWKRAVILLLLLAVPALSTLARHSWYLSPSDVGHFLLTASRTKVAHAPSVVEAPQTERTVVVMTAPEPEAHNRTRWTPETPPQTPSIGITVSLQHRSPPVALL